MFSITSTIPSHHLRSPSIQIHGASRDVSSLLENTNRFDTKPSMMLNKHYEKQLPIDNHKMDFLYMVKSCDVLLLRGAPGSGKSTRAPPYVLSEGGNDVRILCTEPRKGAAITLAKQVAKEGGVKLTHDLTSCIGYAVRGDKCFPAARGSLLYSTTGWAVSTIMLHKFTHIFVDEIHERLLDMDMLLLLLKKIRNLRQMKIILMSADLNISFLTDYFKEFIVKSIDVGGTPFPVDHYFLDTAGAPDLNRDGITDAEAIQIFLDWFKLEGNLLIFLDNVKSINALSSGSHQRFTFVPLHGSLTQAQQVDIVRCKKNAATQTMKRPRLY